MTRTTAIKRDAAMAAAAALRSQPTSGESPAGGRRRIPLVHITDLYHPPQDPDDHIDLATVVALPEYDLRGVVLDATRRFLVAKPEGWDIARIPGFAPVAQLAYLTGRDIPAAPGPVDPLAHPGDTAEDRPAREQAGVKLLLDVLARSREPVTISIVGSCRVLAAAFNREPKLVRARTAAVLLNAGSTGGPKREWNVGLDPSAYIGLWRSGLPIRWFPCGTHRSAFEPAHPRGTFWKVPHADLFRQLPQGLRAWFAYAFTGSRRTDAVRAVEENVARSDWARVLKGERNMWSTASLVMGAGRVLANTPFGWRFVPAADSAGLKTWPCRLDPIRTKVDSDARVHWRLAKRAGPHQLFGRKPGAGYGTAMAEALNALLRGFPW